MKLNNKGFTLIEILATVAIMAILSGTAIMGVTRYIEKTQYEAYKAMQKTVYAAASSYHQHNPSKTSVTIENLKTYGYLETIKDPTSKANVDCTGSVAITSTPGDSTNLDSYKYTVDLKCSKYKDEDPVEFKS